MLSRAWFELLKMDKRQVKFFFIIVLEITGVRPVNGKKCFLCVTEMLKLSAAHKIQHKICGDVVTGYFYFIAVCTAMQ